MTENWLQYVVIVDDPSGYDNGDTTAHGPFDTREQAETLAAAAGEIDWSRTQAGEASISISAIHPGTVTAIRAHHN
jgi:hypothetical protein